MQQLPGAMYHAPHEWPHHVQKELGQRARRYGNLFYNDLECVPSTWAHNVWSNLYMIQYQNYEEAAAELQKLSERPWSPVFWTLQDEGKKICKLLPQNRRVPAIGLGHPAFTLMDKGKIIASANTNNPFFGTDPRVPVNKTEPPSAAFRKLEEALLRMGYFPNQGQRCLDLGACPGGWTWVLARKGASVVSVDRSPLAPSLQKNKNIDFRSGNAFTFDLSSNGSFDLICSDLICYPQALWDWFWPLFQTRITKRWILTIKMQKEPDWAIIDKFKSVEGGSVYHGSYNKHELTFIYPATEKVRKETQ